MCISAFVSTFTPSARLLRSSSSLTTTSTLSTRRTRVSTKINMSTTTASQVGKTNSNIKRLSSGATVHNGVIYLPPFTSTNGADTSSQLTSIMGTISTALAEQNSDMSSVLSVSALLSPEASIDSFNGALSTCIPDSPPLSTASSTYLPKGSLLSIQVTAAINPSEPIIQTPDAAQAVGPYNQAIATSDGTVYISGCIGLTADTGVMAGDTVTSQMLQALSNLFAILQKAGCAPGDIVKTTLLLDDMSDFATVNELYSQFFSGTRVPSRSCFAAKTLPKGALVEIEAIAKKN